jgi:alkyl sulfatase BDS1-like metallo-beta-lactamase superfamily hydrolase
MSEPMDATEFTRQLNRAMRDDPTFDWGDRADWESSQRGFIARLEDPVITNAAGTPVWDLRPYAFLREETAPATVNPSLWRQARLNMVRGLFQVTDRIFQVRGHDLSVMSVIQGDTGYILVDPLICAETAKASLDLVRENLGDRPVVAVIYTHSHIDHWGGVKGVVSEADVQAGKVKIIAPDGFMKAAISENVMAGTVMGRRASYMYGSLLPKDARGQVDAGLGKATASGTVTLIPPTDTITETGTKMTVDGVEIVFQNAPGTEAPAEMHFYFPQLKALCMAENCTHNLHNLYTLRGAEVRDAQAWAHYVNEAIELFGDKTDVIFASHHWPTWGRERCLEFMQKQRDMYKYLHDETLRLANQGYTMTEVAEMIELPRALAKEWYNRGYYGTVSHDVKAIFQKYLGWFDGNPANLHVLPPVEASKRYVDFMGGADAVLARAREYHQKGDYRWVAQVVSHVVFADPDNAEARRLEAEALEQLGYQAESGPWRNFYLTGAMELRDGVVKKAALSSGSPDAIKAMTLEMFFDYMAVRLNGPRAEGKIISVNVKFADIDRTYLLRVANSVLNYFPEKQEERADVTLSLTRATWDEVMVGVAKLPSLVASGQVKLEGNPEKLRELFSLLDSFDFWFNIVTP